MAAVVWEKKSGKVERMLVKLNRKGNGSTTVPFNRQQTERIYVVAVNASTRYNCRAGDFTYSCKGTPRDDQAPFKLAFRVITGGG